MKMTSRRVRLQRGVAAVELAVVLPVLVTLLTVPIFFGMYFMHYTVAQKAAHGAARYMSQVSKTDMRSPVLAVGASKVADDIARDMLGDLALDDSLNIEIECDTFKCDGGNTPPATVQVAITFRLKDYLFGGVDTGDYGWDITAQVTMRYGGM